MILRRNLAIPAAVGIVAVIVLAVLVLTAGRLLVVQDRLDKADLCVALAGGEQRADYAVSLYHAGLCDRLMFIGGLERDGSLAAYRKAFAVAENVPADAVITLPGKVYSTYDEINRLKGFLDAGPDRPVTSITLISSPYHMRRARMVFRWIFADAGIFSGSGLFSYSESTDDSDGQALERLQMAPVPHDLRARKWLWWTDRGTASMVGREYVKLVYYVLRYRLPLPSLNDWLARFQKEW